MSDTKNTSLASLIASMDTGSAFEFISGDKAYTKVQESALDLLDKHVSGFFHGPEGVQLLQSCVIDYPLKNGKVDRVFDPELLRMSFFTDDHEPLIKTDSAVDPTLQAARAVIRRLQYSLVTTWVKAGGSIPKGMTNADVTKAVWTAFTGAAGVGATKIKPSGSSIVKRRATYLAAAFAGLPVGEKL